MFLGEYYCKVRRLLSPNNTIYSYLVEIYENQVCKLHDYCETIEEGRDRIEKWIEENDFATFINNYEG